MSPLPDNSNQVCAVTVDRIACGRHFPRWTEIQSCSGIWRRWSSDRLQVVISPVPLCLFEPCCRSGPRIMSSATLLRALIHLSTNSALFPRRLKLQGVKMFEDDPVDQRRYGDIWKGISHDQIVCVKISGPYQRIPTQNLEPESQEALLWGQLSHLNILPFYGIHLNELMVRGGWSMKHSQLLETRSSTFLYSKIYRWAQGTEENKV